MLYVAKDRPMTTKVKLWFQAAVREFPWATHYGKLDTDTFPYFNSLISRLPIPSATCESYFGAIVKSHGCGLKDSRSIPAYDNQGQTILFSDSAASSRRRQLNARHVCMHGSFYVISQKLAT